ncbi:hypothetical protein SALBM135S_08375 [Streptomyces alboniger]
MARECGPAVRRRGADGSWRHGRTAAPHGSLSTNRALMTPGLVDRVQVTLFPVITGRTGLDPIFHGSEDFGLELIEHRTLDGHTQELLYRPTLHG